MKRPGTLFLVRHGESGWNRERLIQGQFRAAPGLTTAGRADAAAAAGDVARRAQRLHRGSAGPGGRSPRSAPPEAGLAGAHRSPRTASVSPGEFRKL
jgi:broad specificity phosphatase PhoE